MKTVRILGNAPNLGLSSAPGPHDEVWCSNQRHGYRTRDARYAEVELENYRGWWTHWFNIHPLAWIQDDSPREWLRLQSLPTDRPVILQRQVESVPASQAFERKEIQKFFSQDGKPFRFFTFSAAWLIARAVFLGFERIELWGFMQAQEHRYAFERPCFFWWIQEARRRGIEVFVPPEVVDGPAGDPSTYNGPLYGFETHGLDALAPVGAIRLPNVGTYGKRRIELTEDSERIVVAA